MGRPLTASLLTEASQDPPWALAASSQGQRRPGRDDDDRAWCVLDASSADGAEQYPSEAATAARSDHQKFGAARRIDQRGRRIAGKHGLFDDGRHLAEGVCHDAMDQARAPSAARSRQRSMTSAALVVIDPCGPELVGVHNLDARPEGGRMIHCPPQRRAPSESSSPTTIRLMLSNVPSPTSTNTRAGSPYEPHHQTGRDEVGLRPEHDSPNARVRGAARGLRRLDAPPGTTGGTGWLASWWVSMIRPAAAPPWSGHLMKQRFVMRPWRLFTRGRLPLSEGWNSEWPADEDWFRDDARTLVDRLIEECGDAASAVEIVRVPLRCEGPAFGLLERSRSADLLVVGSAWPGRIQGLLLGSVSTQCVHHATCPVVVIPSRSD